MSDRTTAPELLVDRMESGCIAVELILYGKTFYVEIGQTRYSAYLQDPNKATVYFEGEINA